MSRWVVIEVPFVLECFRERDIGGWPICVGYGILTVDQRLGCCGDGYPRLAPPSVSSSRSKGPGGRVFAGAASSARGSLRPALTLRSARKRASRRGEGGLILRDARCADSSG